MSTGLNCEFLEVPGRGHYYILEHGSAPKDAWDWREYATAYGPFATESAAEDHLACNHANPGGSNSRGVVTPDREPLKGLIEKAVKPGDGLGWMFRNNPASRRAF